MATPIVMWSAAGVAGLVIGWMLKRRGRSRAAGTLAILLALLPGPLASAQTADRRFEVASIRVRQDTEAGRTGVEENGGVVRSNLPLRAREQMGLRLEQSPVTVDFVVIDRVADKPTEN